MSVLIIAGAVVFGVTFVAAVWRWRTHQEVDWLYTWGVAFAGALLTLATVSL